MASDDFRLAHLSDLLNGRSPRGDAASNDPSTARSVKSGMVESSSVMGNSRRYATGPAGYRGQYFSSDRNGGLSVPSMPSELGVRSDLPTVDEASLVRDISASLKVELVDAVRRELHRALPSEGPIDTPTGDVNAKLDRVEERQVHLHGALVHLHGELVQSLRGIDTHHTNLLQQVQSRVASVQSSLDVVMQALKALPRAEDILLRSEADRFVKPLDANYELSSAAREAALDPAAALAAVKGERAKSPERQRSHESPGNEDALSFTQKMSERSSNDPRLISDKVSGHNMLMSIDLANRHERMAKGWHEHVLEDLTHHMEELSDRSRVVRECESWLRRRRHPPQTMLARFVSSSSFTTVSMCLVISNMFVAALEAQSTMKAALENRPDPSKQFYDALTSVFRAVYLAEVVLRFLGLRLAFFTGYDRIWNLIDLSVVVVSYIDEIWLKDTNGADAGSLRILRGLRLFKVLKVMRIVRVFHSLRSMVSSIAGSMVSLAWLAVLLFILIVAFSIFFVQASAEHVIEHPEDLEIRDDLADLFPNMSGSMQTLLQCISGGLEWGEVSSAISPMGGLYVTCFTVYVIFVTLGVLNVVIGVFVTEAAENIDPDVMSVTEQHRREDFVREMTELFHSMSGSEGKLTWDDFNRQMKDPAVQSFMRTHQLNCVDGAVLFTLFDQESVGSIDVTQFVFGCLRLKGEARCSDLVFVMEEARRTHHDIVKIYAELHIEVQEMQELLVEIRKISGDPRRYHRPTRPGSPKGVPDAASDLH